MVLAIIQARMGSSRLPGKVLMKVCGKSLLELQIERIRHSRFIDKIVVATTKELIDDAIEILCKDIGTKCFRGENEDVLDRYYKAALDSEIKEGDVLIRLTGDCPLIDPHIIEQMLEEFSLKGFDYFSNIDPPTFPDGLDVEIFTFETLKKVWQEASLPSEREHVTVYIRKHKDRFNIGNFYSEEDFSSFRWTVDEVEDFEIVKMIYEKLYTDSHKIFQMKDILNLYKKEWDMLSKNKKYKRNEGYYKSLEKDKNYFR